jgi:nitroimidazol reductase NimA-like FMN-containing flavoprotein (pyridoxamine 5'-phosphate oxidase superfamily)
MITTTAYGRWQELTERECLALVGQRHLGRLAVCGPDGPLVLPVTYLLHGGAVVFRTAPGGTLAEAGRGRAVAFEVDAVDEGTRTGWSVLVRGVATAVEDPDELARLRALPLVPWAPGVRDRYVRVQPAAVSGRRIALADDLPSNWWG